MGTTRVFHIAMVAFGIAVLLTAWPATWLSAQPAQPGAVQIDNDDIGGVVTSPRGPEAGVWVIAETTDLGTRFAKSDAKICRNQAKNSLAVRPRNCGKSRQAPRKASCTKSEASTLPCRRRPICTRANTTR